MVAAASVVATSWWQPAFSVYDTMTGGPSDVLSKVIIDNNPGGIIYHLPRDTTHKQMVQSRLVRNVTIRLTDERDRLLSLNGLHCQFGLLFEFVASYLHPVPLSDSLRIAAQPHR